MSEPTLIERLRESHAGLCHEAAATITELREQLRDEKVSVALLQMDCHGCVDEEYAAYFNLALKEKTNE